MPALLRAGRDEIHWSLCENGVQTGEAVHCYCHNSMRRLRQGVCSGGLRPSLTAPEGEIPWTKPVKMLRATHWLRRS
jgi:hypothetical protein